LLDGGIAFDVKEFTLQFSPPAIVDMVAFNSFSRKRYGSPHCSFTLYAAAESIASAIITPIFARCGDVALDGDTALN